MSESTPKRIRMKPQSAIHRPDSGLEVMSLRTRSATTRGLHGTEHDKTVRTRDAWNSSRSHERLLLDDGIPNRPGSSYAGYSDRKNQLIILRNARSFDDSKQTIKERKPKRMASAEHLPELSKSTTHTGRHKEKNNNDIDFGLKRKFGTKSPSHDVLLPSKINSRPSSSKFVHFQDEHRSLSRGSRSTVQTPVIQIEDVDISAPARPESAISSDTDVTSPLGRIAAARIKGLLSRSDSVDSDSTGDGIFEEKPFFSLRSASPLNKWKLLTAAIIPHIPKKPKTTVKEGLMDWLKNKRSRERLAKYRKLRDEKNRKRKARKLFREAFFRILWMKRFLDIMIEISQRKTIQSATEVHWHALNAAADNDLLVFNKSFYAKDKAYDRVPFWAKDILRKDPEWRTDVECKRLHALLRGLKGLNRFTERIQLYMCRSAWYQCIDPQRVILRKGHIGQNFYVIYSGSVFVNNEEVLPTGDVMIKTSVILGRGESFGEMSLLKDVRRGATISCREMCELLVVEKEVFATICPKIFDDELEEKVNFLKNQEVFKCKYWNDEDLSSLCLDAQIQEYKTNKVIVSDNYTDEWIYICMEGKCRVIKCLALDEEVQNKTKQSEDVMEGLKILGLDDQAPDNTKKKKEVADEEARKKRDKNRLLDSMALSFLQKDKDRETRRKLFTLRNKWRRNKSKIKPTSPRPTLEDHVIIAKDETSLAKKLNEGGVVTLNTLILNKMKESKDRELVYIEIAQLDPQEVFDLYTILDPPEPKDRTNSLILVSAGTKMCRIRRSAFFKVAPPEAADYAMKIAISSKYPADDILIERYKSKSEWDNYRHKVIDEVISPYKLQARRSYITKYMDNVVNSKRRKSLKVLSTLRRQEKKRKESAQLKSGRLSLVGDFAIHRRGSKAYKTDSVIIDNLDDDGVNGVANSNIPETINEDE